MNTKMITKISLALSAAALTFGCVTPANSVADGNDVRLGQAARLDGPTVKPVEVLEDSRCPSNAQCVWAGQVRLKMLWLRPSGDEPFALTLGKPTPIADGAITLTSVNPAKATARALKPSDYRFSFSFAGGI